MAYLKSIFIRLCLTTYNMLRVWVRMRENRSLRTTSIIRLVVILSSSSQFHSHPLSLYLYSGRYISIVLFKFNDLQHLELHLCSHLMRQNFFKLHCHSLFGIIKTEAPFNKSQCTGTHQMKWNKKEISSREEKLSKSCLKWNVEWFEKFFHVAAAYWTQTRDLEWRNDNKCNWKTMSRRYVIHIYIHSLTHTKMNEENLLLKFLVSCMRSIYLDWGVVVNKLYKCIRRRVHVK